MRESKFRGKRIDAKEWVYGYYYPRPVFDGDGIYPSDHIIVDDRTIATEHIIVDPETVGEFTGLKDKNEKEIYEGDKIQVDEYYIGDYLQNPFIGEVRYSNGSYEVADSEKGACEELNTEAIRNYGMKVIGNVYEK